MVTPAPQLAGRGQPPALLCERVPPNYYHCNDIGEPDAVKAARPVRGRADGKVLRSRRETRRRPTVLGTAAAHMAGFPRILVLCPPHLVPKWKREMEQTIPLARAAIVESITLLEMLRPLFAVMSRERAKLSYRWQAAVIQRWATSKGRLVRGEETGEPFQVPCCPDCTAQITDKDGVPLTDADLMGRRYVCSY